jgi:hypothetical protein
MSINNIIELYKHADQKSVKTMLWFMSKIDYSKLLRRVAYAYANPDETVKCVLLEYDYTSWSYVKLGNNNVIEKMPNSNVLVHHALHTPDFIRLLNNFFANDRQLVNIYCRQKIGANGVPNFHRKQLVVSFQPYALLPQQPPLPSSTILNPEDDMISLDDSDSECERNSY